MYFYVSSACSAFFETLIDSYDLSGEQLAITFVSALQCAGLMAWNVHFLADSTVLSLCDSDNYHRDNTPSNGSSETLPPA